MDLVEAFYTNFAQMKICCLLVSLRIQNQDKKKLPFCVCKNEFI